MSFVWILSRCFGEIWTKEAFGTSYQHPVVNHFLNLDLEAENVFFREKSKIQIGNCALIIPTLPTGLSWTR